MTELDRARWCGDDNPHEAHHTDSATTCPGVDEEPDDGLVLIAGILYDAVTLDEATQ